VDEQRNGVTNSARQGLQFYARCAREAWQRSWDAASAWPAIVVLLVLYSAARLAGLDLSVPGDTDRGVLIGTSVFIVAAWLAVFLVQFVAAPPRLCARLDAERRALARQPASPPVIVPAAPVLLPLTPPSRVGHFHAPRESGDAPPPPMTGEEVQQRPRPSLAPIDVRLHDQVHETEVDTTGARLPVARAYRARVANRGDRRIRRCQIFVCNATHIQVVTGPFDLAPGEHRDLPVLRVVDSDEPHALLYFLDPRTWDVADGQAAWLPEPGRWRLKVLSADAPEAAIELELAATGTPRAWTLVEAAEGPVRRRPARGARVRAVAEPVAGD
jgi:hypothetical protein